MPRPRIRNKYLGVSWIGPNRNRAGYFKAMLRHGSQTLQKRFASEVDAARWVNEKYAWIHPGSEAPNKIPS
jgi:hypothetical protein